MSRVFCINMGIYGSNQIYGVRMTQHGEASNTIHLLFEKKFETRELTAEEKREAAVFYDTLADKENVYFTLYMECSSSLEPVSSSASASQPFLCWFPISLTYFLQMFSK